MAELADRSSFDPLHETKQMPVPGLIHRSRPRGIAGRRQMHFLLPFLLPQSVFGTATGPYRIYHAGFTDHVRSNARDQRNQPFRALAFHCCSTTATFLHWHRARFDSLHSLWIFCARHALPRTLRLRDWTRRQNRNGLKGRDITNRALKGVNDKPSFDCYELINTRSKPFCFI